MDFRKLEDFPNFTKRKLNNIIKTTDKYDLDSVSYNNKLHQLTNLLKHLHGSDICFLETHINLTKTFREYKSNKTMESYMENMWCGYYDDTTPKNDNFIKSTRSNRSWKKIC